MNRGGCRARTRLRNTGHATDFVQQADREGEFPSSIRLRKPLRGSKGGVVEMIISVEHQQTLSGSSSGGYRGVLSRVA